MTREGRDPIEYPAQWSSPRLDRGRARRLRDPAPTARPAHGTRRRRAGPVPGAVIEWLVGRRPVRPPGRVRRGRRVAMSRRRRRSRSAPSHPRPERAGRSASAAHRLAGRRQPLAPLARAPHPVRLARDDLDRSAPGPSPESVRPPGHAADGYAHRLGPVPRRLAGRPSGVVPGPQRTDRSRQDLTGRGAAARRAGLRARYAGVKRFATLRAPTFVVTGRIGMGLGTCGRRAYKVWRSGPRR